MKQTSNGYGPVQHTQTLGVPTVRGQFWTAKQRAAHSLHELPYRACFKPELPEYFIERYTKPGGLVYDPFLGRGTTMVGAALQFRRSVGLLP